MESPLWNIINRTSVVGTVLKHLCHQIFHSFIHSFIHLVILLFRIFKALTLQTVRAKELKFLKNVHPPPCVFHMSCVTCHVSCGTCHMSCVTFFSLFLDKTAELVSVGSGSTGPTPTNSHTNGHKYLLPVSWPSLRMAGVFLTSFLMLLPHFVPAKVFLVETESENNETGANVDNNSGGQDYNFGFKGLSDWDWLRQTDLARLWTKNAFRPTSASILSLKPTNPTTTGGGGGWVSKSTNRKLPKKKWKKRERTTKILALKVFGCGLK